MKRLLILIVLAVALVGCSDEAEGAKNNKRRANDVFLTNYTDYFINDSDGSKDAVFTIYHEVPIAGKGKCDVVKVYDAEAGVGVDVLCPNREGAQ